MGQPAHFENDELFDWESYLLHRSKAARAKLITRYEALASMLAAKLYANRQIDEIEFDEYKQYAMIGLIESIDRFDPQQGASFNTYASHRIKGAILTGIEKHNEKQQQIAARTRLKKERAQSMMEGFQANASEDTFSRLVELALGLAVGFMLEDSGMYATGDEVQSSSVYKGRELDDLVRVVDALVKTLPSQEEKIIRMHYYQNGRFDLIAQEMGISKGRVSQMHRSALHRLSLHYDELKLVRSEY